MVDPLAFAERVLQPLHEQLLRKVSSERNADLPPDELLADALVVWLAERLVGAGPTGDEGFLGFDGDDVTASDEVMIREQILADALGACTCWGRDIDCDVCSGMGAPGWRTPDPGLFDEYVAPAVTAVTNHRNVAGSSAGTDHIDRKGNGHV